MECCFAGAAGEEALPVITLTAPFREQQGF